MNTNLSLPPVLNILQHIKNGIDSIEITNSRLAAGIIRLIPASCPFERKISFRGRELISIPPLCKLNPVYNELVALRYRAVCYLESVEQGDCT